MAYLIYPVVFFPLYLSGCFKNYLGFFFLFVCFLVVFVVLKEIGKELQIYVQKLMENEKNICSV